MEIRVHDTCISERKPRKHNVNTKEDLIMDIRQHDIEVQLISDGLLKGQPCRPK